MLIAARVPQIWTNFKTKSAGQLAIVTWFLNLAGTTARVFTTLKETGDVGRKLNVCRLLVLY